MSWPPLRSYVLQTQASIPLSRQKYMPLIRRCSYASGALSTQEDDDVAFRSSSIPDDAGILSLAAQHRMTGSWFLGACCRRTRQSSISRHAALLFRLGSPPAST